MRWSKGYCFCAVVGICFSAAAPAQSVDEGKVDRPWIPFAPTSSGLIIIPVIVNGKPINALVDTGVPGVILSKDFAEEEGYALTPVGVAQDVGGPQQRFSTPHFQLNVSNIIGPDAPIQVEDFSRLERASGMKFDVMIGASYISKYGFQVDFDKHKIRFSTIMPKYADSIIVPVKYDGQQFIISATTNKFVLSPLFLDTGSDGAVMLTNASIKGIEKGNLPATDIEYIGAGGSEIYELKSLQNFKIGSANFGTVEALVSASSHVNDRPGMIGALGLQVLSKYNIAIDSKANQLLLFPRSQPPAAVARSTVGIQGDYDPSRIIVTHVMKNSPAEKAGFKKGDSICAVDGVIVRNGWADSPMRHWGIASPGHHYSISLCTGRIVKLTTAQFY